MRKDKSFTENKLTTEEFTKKYWLDGDSPYQYHTMNIEDGRDEREQLIINNIRALDEHIKFYSKYNRSAHEGMGKRTTALSVTSMVVAGAAITFLVALFSFRKSR